MPFATRQWDEAHTDAHILRLMGWDIGLPGDGKILTGSQSAESRPNQRNLGRYRIP